jgi:hypothetical protein
MISVISIVIRLSQLAKSRRPICFKSISSVWYHAHKNAWITHRLIKNRIKWLDRHKNAWITRWFIENKIKWLDRHNMAWITWWFIKNKIKWLDRHNMAWITRWFMKNRIKWLDSRIQIPTLQRMFKLMRLILPLLSVSLPFFFVSSIIMVSYLNTVWMKCLNS